MLKKLFKFTMWVSIVITAIASVIAVIFFWTPLFKATKKVDNVTNCPDEIEMPEEDEDD